MGNKIQNITNTLDNLEARWQAEKEYEDFSEYKNVMKNVVDGEINYEQFCAIAGIDSKTRKWTE